jgi:hypothetical protein
VAARAGSVWTGAGATGCAGPLASTRDGAVTGGTEPAGSVGAEGPVAGFSPRVVEPLLRTVGVGAATAAGVTTMPAGPSWVGPPSTENRDIATVIAATAMTDVIAMTTVVARMY